GMITRGVGQLIAPFQFVQARLFAFVVDQIEELLLQPGRSSLGLDDANKNEASNRGNGAVHVQCTLYVRSCYFLRVMEVMALRFRRQRRARYSPNAIPAPSAIAIPRKYRNNGTPMSPIARKPDTTMKPAAPAPTRILCIEMPG